jgi:pimeloyl-ACP methyl ester carboxylesterase
MDSLNQPSRPHRNLIESDDPDAMSPLAAFDGTRPPAPQWFTDALAQEPERSFTQVDGAAIETLTWGARGKPGLILVPGTNAHADWWSFIAPFFADRMRVVALSVSGMGRSDWRDTYSAGGHAREIAAVAEAAGLFDGPIPPVAVGHSFGGMIVAHMLSLMGERFQCGILVDSLFVPPDREPRAAPRRFPNRVMASVQEAVTRFRLAPPQRVDNPFILDHLARLSLKAVDGGVSWCFDPFIFRKMTERVEGPVIGRVRAPVAMISGSRSLLVTEDALSLARALAAQPMPEIVIPDAAHHILVDQPLALVAAIRSLLSVWPAGGISAAQGRAR